MERLRQVWLTIVKQLGQLGSSQKLLIGSLAVIVAMTLFLVSQYAGSAKFVAVAANATPEEQNHAYTYLLSVGFPAEMREGKVVVPAERQYVALAQLAQAKALPANKAMMFGDLVEKQNLFVSKGQADQMFNTALQNELAKVIRNFSGIDDAQVFVSAPQGSGIGMTARKPVAQVTVFTGKGGSGGGLDQKTVDALADVVAGAVSGLDAKSVKVIDGSSRRTYRASSPEDAGAQSYMEQAIVVEDRVRRKLEDHLGAFISGVVVSVNAMVDAAKKEKMTERALPKGAGTVAVPSRDSTTTSASGSTSRSGEPGLAPNVGADINAGNGAGGTSTNTETVENEYATKIGTEREMVADARGRPTKINVTVSVPRDYVVEILKGRAAAGATSGGGTGAATGSATEPAEADIEKEWTAQQTLLVSMIKPLIDTKDVPGTIAEAGDVVVSLMPVVLGTVGGGGGGARTGIGSGIAGGSGGGGGIVAKLLNGGVIKQVVLSVLALVALGMMFVLVKKTSKPPEMPTAEELVGIPPAISPDSDLVGEADESDTAMLGIEVDSDSLKTGKMLEEVQDHVRKNPQAAATVFTRWLAAEE